MSICTNCALLAWLYDQEGKWKIEPGLAAILVMEHVLLLIKFGFSRFVPEVISLSSTPAYIYFFRSLSFIVDFYVVSQEPAWVRANRVKNATQAQDLCTKQLLRTISGGERTLMEVKKLEPPGG